MPTSNAVQIVHVKLPSHHSALANCQFICLVLNLLRTEFQEYPGRYFTHFALALFAVVLGSLTTINRKSPVSYSMIALHNTLSVAAVGYETITVVRDDFNAMHKFWW